jgi:predicted house-cleaning noncanonical NTP pyrophosphatase (MazG superfamily)|tara:strand:+ start:406 stop:873 length:468 start_codon:yes stop_codon:yes gene_type:complete
MPDELIVKADKELREEAARIICCLSDDPKECGRCARDKGCPDSWADVARKVDQTHSLYLSHNRYLLDWLKEYAKHGGQEPLANVLEDIRIHSPFEKEARELHRKEFEKLFEEIEDFAESEPIEHYNSALQLGEVFCCVSMDAIKILKDRWLKEKE